MTHTATYFDNATNHYGPVAEAIAKAARETRTDGTAWTVTFDSTEGPKFWDGCRYDVIALAKDIVWNGGNATVTAPNGDTYTADKVPALTF